MKISIYAMKISNFTTLFLNDVQACLHKDPGMIPQIMNKCKQYKSTYVSYIDPTQLAPQYQNIQNINLVKINEFPKSSNFYNICNLHAILFLIKNAKKIDVLNLYFLKYSLIYGSIYKLLNNKGICYIKLDINVDKCKAEEASNIDGIRTFIFNKFLQFVPDIISVETKNGMNYMQNKYKGCINKLIYIPNGIDDTICDAINRKSFHQKSNIMITVGRIGAPEKNHELLLESVINLDWKDWKLMIIGPIESSFQDYINQYFLKYPTLKSHITFLGPIYDKCKLFEWYNMAKIFCMTSKTESFGLVFPEAQFFGNYIVSSKVSSIDDFTNESYLTTPLGKTITSATELQTTLQLLIDQPSIIEKVHDQIVEHAQQFKWSNIIDHLDNTIRSKYKN